MGDLVQSFEARRAEYDDVERPLITVPQGGAEVTVLRCSKRQRKTMVIKVLEEIDLLRARLAADGPNEEILQQISRLQNWLGANARQALAVCVPEA